MRERGLRREVDLLLGQLVVDVGVDEAVTPGQQTAGDDQQTTTTMTPALVSYPALCVT